MMTKSKKEIEYEMEMECGRLGVSKRSKGHKIIKTITKQVVGKRKRKGLRKDKSGNWVVSGKLFDTYKTVIIGKYRKPSEKSRTKTSETYSYGTACIQHCSFDHEDVFEQQLHGGRCFCLCHKENKHQSVAEIMGMDSETVGRLLGSKN